MTKPKPATIMIATPMYGGLCTSSYVHGLLRTVVNLQARGMNVVWGQLTNESLIPRGRNELVRLFMEQDYEYLMFIDADIGFDETGVQTLLDADRDIACGIYPKKEIDWEGVTTAAAEGKARPQDYAGAFVFNTVHDAAGGNEGEDTDTTGCFEVRHGGTGFMLIKRHVFDKLAEHVPEYRTSSFKGEEGNYRRELTKEFFATSIDHTGTLLSEDYHFCELWRNHGGKVYANPFIKLEHVGQHVYSGDVLKSGGNIK